MVSIILVAYVIAGYLYSLEVGVWVVMGGKMTNKQGWLMWTIFLPFMLTCIISSVIKGVWSNLSKE